MQVRFRWDSDLFKQRVAQLVFSKNQPDLATISDGEFQDRWNKAAPGVTSQVELTMWAIDEVEGKHDGINAPPREAGTQ